MSKTTDLVIVNEESLQQDFSLTANCAIYERSGKVYKSTVKEIPLAAIEKIREIALLGRQSTGPNLSDYGINESTLAANIEVMLREAGDNSQLRLDELPENLRSLFDFDAIAAYATDRILSRTARSDSSITVTMTGEEPKDALTISSKHDDYLRLPWTVSTGENSWLCYSRELSRLLAGLVSDANAAQLRQNIAWSGENANLESSSLISDCDPDSDSDKDADFFKHYGRFVRPHFDSQKVREEAAKLPGYDVADQIYATEKAIGTVIANMLVRDGEYILENQPYLKLTTRADQNWLVDCIGWTADTDWHDLITKHKVLENAAKTTNWLADWKAADPERSIFVEILKDNKESWFDDESLENIWDKHELATKPDFHFYLRQGDKCIYDLFVGFPFETSVVTTIENKHGEGVEIIFDKIAVKTPGLTSDSGDGQFYIPLPPVRSRAYAVVSNTGTVEAVSQPGNKNAMRVVGHPAEEADAERDEDRREDPYTWDEVEDLLHRNTFTSPLAVQSDQVDFGLVGRDGLIVLAPQYDFIERFYEGLAKIRNNEGKYGFIDLRGQLVIEPQFDRADHFRNGITVALKEGKWGYIDTSGNTVIPFIYEAANPFYEGVASVRLDYRYGYIDTTGRFVIEPRFTRARRFINGLALVQIDGKRGYIDHAGRLLGNKLYSKIGLFWEGMAAFNEEGKCGYINTEGKEVIAAQFKNANPFRDGVAMVRLDPVAVALDAAKKAVLADNLNNEKKEGEADVEIPPPLDPARDYFIDKTGSFVEPVRSMGGSRMELHANVMRTRDKALRRFARFQGEAANNLVTVHASAGWFKEGLCPVEFQGKWGAINTNGTLVLAAKYDELGAREREWFTEGLIPACEGGKWGAMDITGTYIFKTDFDQMGLFYKGFAAVRQGSKYGFINNKGEVIVTPQFDTVSGFDKHGLAHIGLQKQTSTPSFPAKFV